jgi:hypothetical protein
MGRAKRNSIVFLIAKGGLRFRHRASIHGGRVEDPPCDFCYFSNPIFSP